MRLLNLTSHPARELVLLDREGDEWHVVLAKTTWTRAGEVASEQFDVALADEIGEGGALIKPSDVALERTGTSVLCSGAVMAPTARLEVGRVRRPIRAYGERRWERRAGAWTAVEVSPFAPVDARFENAFGGSSGAIRFEENPVGRGFWREASGIDPADIALPLVEDAARPLGAPETMRRRSRCFPFREPGRRDASAPARTTRAGSSSAPRSSPKISIPAQ